MATSLRGRGRGPIVLLCAVALLALTVWFGAALNSEKVAEEPEVLGPAGYDRTGIDLPKPVRPVPQVALGEAADDAPNVLYVMADDMRYDDLRFMPFAREFFGEGGTTYLNSFSPFPWCCPARASFVSGQLAQNHEVFKSTSDYGFQMFDDSRTIATALREAGYNNAFVGRYLNGYGKDVSYVTGGRSARYVPAGWDEWLAIPGLDLSSDDPLVGGPFQYYRSTLNVNGTLEPRRGQYQTSMLGRESRRILQDYAREDRPWFLYMAPAAPHWGRPYCEPDDPCNVKTAEGLVIRYNTPARPKWVRGMFDDITPHSPGIPADGSDPEPDMSDQPSWLQGSVRTPSQIKMYTTQARQRGEALYVLDRQLEQTVDQLEADGELEDTVVIFTSDNGFFLGEHRLPPSKIKPQEPALRVPFMIAGPGVPEGQVRFDPVTTVDATATIADYAGATENFPYPIDGRSLRENLEQGDQGWDELVLYSGHIREMKGSSEAVADIFSDERDGIGIRTPRWSYHVFRDGSEVLYDLDSDPNELENLAAEPRFAELRGQLQDLAVRYKDCFGEQCRRTLPEEFVRDPAENAASTQAQLEGTRSFGPGGGWDEVDYSAGIESRRGIEGNPVDGRTRDR